MTRSPARRAANIDVAVVGVPAKAVTVRRARSLSRSSSTRLLRMGEKRSALRRPLIHRTDQTVFHHPGVEKRPDEFKPTLIGHLRMATRAIKLS